MILEGIVTSLDAEGNVNVAPMGPIVDAAMATLRLRPFRSSHTYRNLKYRPCGVFHVVDDVLLLARAAIDRLESSPPTFPAREVEGAVLQAACRWYEFRIREFDDQEERTNLLAQVVHKGRLRDFFGFNRAKSAVVEAAILATRVHILPKQEILDRFAELEIPIQKTGGAQEFEAFTLLTDFVEGAPSHSGS
jgi:hypothetical protein